MQKTIYGYIPSSVLVSDCGKCMVVKISKAFIRGGRVDLGVFELHTTYPSLAFKRYGVGESTCFKFHRTISIEINFTISYNSEFPGFIGLQLLDLGEVKVTIHFVIRGFQIPDYGQRLTGISRYGCGRNYITRWGIATGRIFNVEGCVYLSPVRLEVWKPNTIIHIFGVTASQ